MREEILAVMAKHKIERFNFYLEDLFTYVLETEELVSYNLLSDLRSTLRTSLKVIHKDTSFPKQRDEQKNIPPLSEVVEGLHATHAIDDLKPPKLWKEVHSEHVFAFINNWAIAKLTPENFERAFKEFCTLTDKERAQFFLYQSWWR